MVRIGSDPSRRSVLQLALDEILDLVDFLLLLIQQVQDHTHGSLLQPHTFYLILQLVLHAAQTERGVDQDHCGEKDKKSRRSVIWELQQLGMQKKKKKSFN